jgi:hypothetical protein
LLVVVVVAPLFHTQPLVLEVAVQVVTVRLLVLQ